MSVKVQILVIFLSVLLFWFVFRNLKKGILDLKYTLIWLLVSLLIVISGLFPGLVFWITKLIGIKTPINTLFLVGIFFLIIITFIQNIIISQLAARLKNIAQEVGIIKNCFRDKIDSSEKN